MEERRSIHSLHNCLRTSRSHPGPIRSGCCPFSSDSTVLQPTAIIYSNNSSANNSNSSGVSQAYHNTAVYVDAQSQHLYSNQVLPAGRHPHQPMVPSSHHHHHHHHHHHQYSQQTQPYQTSHLAKTSKCAITKSEMVTTVTSTSANHQQQSSTKIASHTTIHGEIIGKGKLYGKSQGPAATPGTIVTYTVVRPHTAIRTQQSVNVPLEDNSQVGGGGGVVVGGTEADSDVIPTGAGVTIIDTSEQMEQIGQEQHQRAESDHSYRRRVERSRSAPYSMLSAMASSSSPTMMHARYGGSQSTTSRSSSSSPGDGGGGGGGVEMARYSCSRSSSCNSYSSTSASVTSGTISRSSSCSSDGLDSGRRYGHHHHHHGRHSRHHHHHRSHSERKMSHHKSDMLCGSEVASREHHHRHHSHRHHHHHHRHRSKNRTQRSSSCRTPEMDTSKSWHSNLISSPIFLSFCLNEPSYFQLFCTRSGTNFSLSLRFTKKVSPMFRIEE